MTEDTRTVGERGRVTIPKEFRERFGLRGGDEVVVREDGRIVIERTVDERMRDVDRALRYGPGLDGR
jgi:AbrB family looped-hinge helix DNA binding protein